MKKLINKQSSQYKGQEKIDLNKMARTEDGAVILNGYPFRSGNYEYYEWEVGAGWDDNILIGHIADEEAHRVAMTLKGLPITFGHIFIDTLSEREEHSIGTVISDGEFQPDGQVKAQVVITNGDAIAKFSTQEFNQLSIGFSAEIDTDDVPDGADFVIKNIRLNHVALVEFGRAGAGSSLANSKVIYKEDTMDIKELQATVATLTLENTELKNLKTDFEKLRAENDMLKQSQKSDTDIEKKALELANSWQDLGAKIMEMTGENSAVPLSDKVGAMKSALVKAGHSLPDGASDVYVESAFDFALKNAQSKAKPIEASIGIGSFDENVEKILGGK